MPVRTLVHDVVIWVHTGRELKPPTLFFNCPHHLIESRVPGFPRDLSLAFGSLVWIWKQVGLYIWIGIRSFFRNLEEEEMDS